MDMPPPIPDMLLPSATNAIATATLVAAAAASITMPQMDQITMPIPDVPLSLPPAVPLPLPQPQITMPQITMPQITMPQITVPEVEANSRSISMATSMATSMPTSMPTIIPTYSSVLTFKQLFSCEIMTNAAISADFQYYLLVLCKNKPNLLDEMEQTLKQIILDGKIDARDIPAIMKLVITIYHLVKENKNGFQADKYIIIQLFVETLFVVYMNANDIRNEDLKQLVFQIIASSIELIKLKKPKRNLMDKMNDMIASSKA